MDALFCDSSPHVHYITLEKIAPVYLALSTDKDMQTDSPDAADYESYIDSGFIRYSLEPLSFGTALGFGLITLFILFTYGVSKALSLVRIKNQ